MVRQDETIQEVQSKNKAKAFEEQKEIFSEIRRLKKRY